MRKKIVIMMSDRFLCLGVSSLILECGDCFDVVYICNSLLELENFLLKNDVEYVVTNCRGQGDTFDTWYAFYFSLKERFKRTKVILMDTFSSLHVHCLFFNYSSVVVACIDIKSRMQSCMVDLSQVLSDGRLLTNIGSDYYKGKKSLTINEIKVIKLYLAGLPTSLIAKNVNKSSKSVSFYKKNAMKKLGLRNNVELIQFGSHSCFF